LLIGIDGGHRAAGQSKARYLTSPNVIMDAMLRKTTAKNVWIWVCSLKYELYVRRGPQDWR